MTGGIGQDRAGRPRDSIERRVAEGDDARAAERDAVGDEEPGQVACRVQLQLAVIGEVSVQTERLVVAHHDPVARADREIGDRGEGRNRDDRITRGAAVDEGVVGPRGSGASDPVGTDIPNAGASTPGDIGGLRRWG